MLRFCMKSTLLCIIDNLLSFCVCFATKLYPCMSFYHTFSESVFIISISTFSACKKNRRGQPWKRLCQIVDRTVACAQACHQRFRMFFGSSTTSPFNSDYFSSLLIFLIFRLDNNVSFRQLFPLIQRFLKRILLTRITCIKLTQSC